jgi:outer membrane protein TolC
LPCALGASRCRLHHAAVRAARGRDACPRLAGDACATASLDLATYWRQLDDPLLTEFVERRRRHNLDLAQSAARLEQARAQLRGARAGWTAAAVGQRPRLAATFSGEFRRRRQYNLGADASWEIDLFGRIGSEVAASEADLAAAGYSLADLQRLITGQVALATISARATALQLAIARDTLAFQDENLQIARWRVQAGWSRASTSSRRAPSARRPRRASRSSKATSRRPPTRSRR